ncbi:MAG: hypothetical protein L3J43_00855 [Sulfurovum sp.]|nr:hypothetical protein [Sulfurovum sp.]
MRKLLKYILVMIILTILVLFYFRYTESGQKNAYTLASMYATHKLGIPIDIQKININQLPFVKADILLNKQYKVHLNGFIENKHMKLRYTLNSDCFTSNVCTFEDDIQIKGTLTGWGDHLKISGKGKAIDGNITYNFIKESKQYKDMSLTFKDVNSSKLFTLLHEKAFFKGKATATVNFDFINKDHKQGTVVYDVSVNKNNFYGLPTHFHTQIDIHDDLHTFNVTLKSPDIELNITEGKYDKNRKSAHAKYTLDIQDLSSLEEILKNKYAGSLHTAGDIRYENEKIYINGKSKDFGGILHFSYVNKILELDLEKLSLPILMKTFNIKSPILDANIIGKGTYNLTKKIMELNTTLHQTRLLPSSLLKSIEKKFSLSLQDDTFDKSSFSLSLKDANLTSNLTLANKHIHLILKNTKINNSYDAIGTTIDIKLPKHTAKGKLFIRNTGLKEKPFQEFYLTFDGSVEKYYNLTLDGLISESFTNLNYTLNAKRLPSHICTIVDDINLSGQVSGSLERLYIAGEGLAMEGKVKFKGKKAEEHFEDVSLQFQNIHALKLFTLLGKPEFPNGKADLNTSLSYISSTKAKGTVDYSLKKGMYKKLPLALKTHLKLNNKDISFSTQATLSTADINITKGAYNFDTNISKAFYTLSSKNLSPLESLIGKYRGPFSATGTITHKKNLQVRGLSQTFGGMIDFLYKKDMLYIDLEKVSLTRLMRLFDYPHIFTAQVNGNINYDYKKEQFLVRSDLNNTRFLKSDLVHTIFKKSGINMRKELFSQSTLFAIYQHNILAGDLILKNKQSHFIVKNTQINTKKDTVHANFDLRMQGQAFSGTVYGSLQDPKVKLDMKKLMRYQMDKQVDSVIGKGNRELMESMPMGGAAKDVATDMGAGIMEMFF